MTNEDIKKQIDTLENARFNLKMKDRWNANDYQRDTEWQMQICELEKMLEEE